jgi:hypothetical protein
MLVPRSRVHLLAALPLLTACSDDGSPPDTTRETPPDIAYGAVGSLSGAAGKSGFRFGAASAATQIEDRNESTDWYWFTLPEDRGGLGKGTFVGEASRGYTKALEDVGLLEEMGLDSYRFSIEWARIEPARGMRVDSELEHYSQLLDALGAAGIRPVVTVHHFSNPVWVDDPRHVDCAGGPTDANLCGFGHPQGGPLVIQAIAEHAALLARTYGDRVDDWGTLNEPFNYLLAAYGTGVFPPGKSNIFNILDGFVPVMRDTMLAHAAIYEAIKENDTVDADSDGVAANVGLSLSIAEWVAARRHEVSDEPEDTAARDRMIYVYNHMFVDAIQTGLFDSDLDGEGDQELPGLKGTLDWLGVQYYFRAGVTGDAGLVPVLDLTPCVGTLDNGACLPPVEPSSCVPAMRYEFYAPPACTTWSRSSARAGPGCRSWSASRASRPRSGSAAPRTSCARWSRSSGRAPRGSTSAATTTGA